LFLKFLFLILVPLIFFFSFCLIEEKHLRGLLLCQLFFLILITGISYCILGHKVFFFMVKAQIVGSILYAMIAIPLVLSGLQVSPFLGLEVPLSRWLYVISHPFRMMAVFFSGLVMVEILSPSQFLRFGTIGLAVAFLTRIIEYSIEEIFDTVDVLRMQGDWPEVSRGFHKVHNIWFMIKKSPMLVSVIFRNIICWFLPWGWLSFNVIKDELKGERK